MLWTHHYSHNWVNAAVKISFLTLIREAVVPVCTQWLLLQKWMLASCLSTIYITYNNILWIGLDFYKTTIQSKQSPKIACVVCLLVDFFSVCALIIIYTLNWCLLVDKITRIYHNLKVIGNGIKGIRNQFSDLQTKDFQSSVFWLRCQSSVFKSGSYSSLFFTIFCLHNN